MKDEHQQLLEQLDQIKSIEDAANRGYQFERFIVKLFRDAFIEYDAPYKMGVDQIDGKFHYENKTFIVEIKWTKHKTDKNEIDIFRGKMRRERSHGLFISWSGFEKDLDEDQKDNSILLFIKGGEIRGLLNRRYSLWEMLDYKINNWPRAKYLPTKDNKQLTRRWDRLLEHLSSRSNQELRSLSSKYDSALYVRRIIEDKIEVFIEDDSEKNLFLMIEKAGSGKTNVACSMAEKLSSKHPTIFFNSSNQLIDDDLETTLFKIYKSSKNINASDSTDFFKKLEYLARSHGRTIVIIIDGINENRNYDSMKKNLLRLMYNCSQKRVKLLLTCRDIYWEFFEDDEWHKFIFFESRNALFYFTEEEFDEAISRYFGEYRIRGTLASGSTSKYRHPLLLKFFCEAFADMEIEETKDIRVPELFEVYWRRKILGVATSMARKSRHHHREIGRYIGKIAIHMCDSKKQWISKDKISDVCDERDIDVLDSTYNRILDEHIILEQRRNLKANNFEVKFVYEEFMEFVIAKELIEELQLSTEDMILKRITELTSMAQDFVNMYGVMIYFSILLKKERGISIWPFLAEQGRTWSNVVFDALEKLSADYIDETVIDLIDELLFLTKQPEVTTRLVDTLNHRAKFYNNAGIISVILRHFYKSTKQNIDLLKVVLHSHLCEAEKCLKNIIEKDDSDVELVEFICDQLGFTENQVSHSKRLEFLSISKKHPQPTVRVKVAVALGNIGSSAALEELSELLLDEDSSVRKAIAVSCIASDDPTFIVNGKLRVLESLITDTDLNVRLSVLSSLKTYSHPEVIRVAIRGYSVLEGEQIRKLNHILSDVYRKYALVQTGSSGINGLGPQDKKMPGFLSVFVDGIIHNNAESVYEVYKTFNQPDRDILMRMLCLSEHNNVASILGFLIKNESRKLLPVLLGEIHRVCDDNIIQFLADFVGKGRVSVETQKEIITAIGKMGHQCDSALKRFIELIASLTDRYLQTLCIQQIMNWPAEKVSLFLSQYTSHTNSDVREYIAVYLRNIPRYISALPLKELARDPNPNVAGAARASLDKLGVVL